MALKEFKCPNCGGALEFNPGTQEMTCPYCDSVIDMEALAAMDEELASEKPSEAIDWGFEGEGWGPGEQQGLAVYSCKSCGGEIVGDETLGATSCPFCGNPVVMTSKFSGTLRPDAVIPFKLDKKAAVAALGKHYLGKKLLPPVFKDKNHLDEVKGVYVPFWLFDADADAHVEYTATRTRRWSDSKFDYTETSFFRAVRAGGIGFDDVPVDGSSSVDDTLMESIEPYEMRDSVDFKTAYLAGYLASKYDIDAEQSVDRANARIRNSTEAAFASTVVGYDTVIPKSTHISLRSGGIRYALLPVWLLGTSWQKKNFIFAMNGQTGKFVGDLPLDKSAYRKSFLKIFGISAAILLAIGLGIVSLL